MDPLTKDDSFGTLILIMQEAKLRLQDFQSFVRVFYRYVQKRLHQSWVWFEDKKDLLVGVLVAKRGSYQRPFLHTSLFILIAAGITITPMIRTYKAEANQLEEFTPPSAVLSSFDEQDTQTQISEKPRDQVINYKIEAGDTLAGVADKFGISVDTVKWANPKIIGDKLSIGQELGIPPVTGLVIKVSKGESIYSIAKKYKTEPQNILNYPFNDFGDLDTFALVAGQTLVIPDGVMPEAKPVYSPQLIAQVGKETGSGQFIWPSQGLITQRPVSYHMAVDIANNTLPPVAAADSGTVILVERQRYGYGWHVIIDHQNGYQTLYAHMSDIYVSTGQTVSKGATIGKVGSTGRSSGPHLHFEIRKGGILLNPLNFLSK